jgi:hypothetical protein
MSTFMTKYGQVDDPTIMEREIVIEDPPQDCDVTEDEATMAEMDRSLRELADVAKDMEEVGGMSQRLATEAERILPGVLGRPVGYYTQAPSATHYRISMEEVHKGIWALVAAAAVAVVAAIYKIYTWLSGSSSDSGGGKGGSGGAKANTEKEIDKQEKLQEKGPEYAEGMKDAVSTIKNQGITYQDKKGKTKEYNSLESIIENLFLQDQKYDQERRTLAAPDGITYDIIYDGDYTKLMHNFAQAKAFEKAGQVIRDQLKVLEEVINEDRNANGNQVVGLVSRLEKVKQAAPAFRLNGKEMTLRDAKTLISSQRDKAMAKKPPSRLHFDDMFNRLETMFKRKDVVDLLNQGLTYLETIDELEKQVETLKGHVGDLATDDAPGGNSAKIAQMARSILNDIHHHVIGFANLMGEIKHYSHDVTNISKMCAGFAREIVQRISADMDEKTMSDGWKKIKAQILGAQKAIQESHFPSGYHDPAA